MNRIYLQYEIKKRRIRKYCSKLKKGKLKTKTFLEITILDKKEPLVQSAQKQCKSEVEQICIYQNLGSGRGSGFQSRKNPKQQYLKVVPFSDVSFIKRNIYIYNHAAQIINP